MFGTRALRPYSCPGCRVVRRWSAKPLGVSSILTLDSEMQRWCNGSIEVSKTFDLGSNPGLCVLSRTLIRKAYILVTRLYSEVGSIPTASATCSLEQSVQQNSRWRLQKLAFQTCTR